MNKKIKSVKNKSNFTISDVKDNRRIKNMSIHDNLAEISKSLENLEETGIYDVEKYSCSLKHFTNQLEYFYCHLVKDGGRDIDSTYYHLPCRPKIHQLAYFNIGRGFPKELMDGHWCYVLKDLGYKMLIIPCTSLKGTSCNPEFEFDIDVMMSKTKTKSRLQLSEIRCVDMQRLDLRKPFCEVLSNRQEIIDYVEEHLLK